MKEECRCIACRMAAAHRVPPPRVIYPPPPPPSDAVKYCWNGCGAVAPPDRVLCADCYATLYPPRKRVAS